MEALANADMCGLYIPQEYGGFGGGVFELCLAVEELSKVCVGISLAMAATALGTFPILLFGNEEQKQKYLPGIAAGKTIAAFGLTEANAGSDALGMKTTAVLDGDHYVLNGTKQWITNGENASVYTVMAKTNPAKEHVVSVLLLLKSTPVLLLVSMRIKWVSGHRVQLNWYSGLPYTKGESAGQRKGMGSIVAINT